MKRFRWRSSSRSGAPGDHVAQLTGGYTATQSVVAAVDSGTAVPLTALAGG
ncbi:hypothetical protein [Dactylosporangium sp. NPDC051484]|uniref:hypothetical protein n=1 Tax=Dactylosporangium sp. NPDC051484 TaxID=3154942 RepID=UPI00344CA402